MNKSILKKLEQLSMRLEEINALLSDQTVVSDQDKYRELSIEHAQLSPVNDQYQQYLSTINNIPNEEIIKKYREDANLLKNELLQSAIKKLEAGSDPDLVVEELADKLTNKLLHTTFDNIKKSPKINLEKSKDSVPVLKKPTNIHNS